MTLEGLLAHHEHSYVLGFHHARDAILARIGRDTRREGLSFQQFIDFLSLEDLDQCDPRHGRQCHAVERLVLTAAHARSGPWPQQLLTPLARERLSALYADDIARYAVLR